MRMRISAEENKKVRVVLNFDVCGFAAGDPVDFTHASDRYFSFFFMQRDPCGSCFCKCRRDHICFYAEGHHSTFLSASLFDTFDTFLIWRSATAA